MTEGLWGVLIGAAIGVVGTLIMQVFEGRRQAARLEAERKQRREDFWCETVTAPFLEQRLDALKEIIELLGVTESEALDEDRIGLIVSFVPIEVVLAMKGWTDARANASRAGEDMDSKELRTLRFEASVVASKCLCELVSPEAVNDWVDHHRIQTVTPKPDPKPDPK